MLSPGGAVFPKGKAVTEELIKFCTGLNRDCVGVAKGIAGKNRAVYGPPVNRPVCKRRKDVLSKAKCVPKSLVL